MGEKRGVPNFTNKKLRANWLASLPLGHNDELEKALMLAIGELNASVIPPHQRYISLETISEPLSQVFEDVKKKIFNSSFPATDKHQQYIQNFCMLIQQVADGYLKTIESLSSHGYDRNGSFFTTSIYRAIQLNFTLQYLAYTNYQVPNKMTWGHLHKLYQLAHAERVHLENVIAGPLDLVHAEHIEALYKQALLLSLASPFQLSNSFSAKLTSTLAYWVQYCNLYDIVEPTSYHGLFAVQLNSNSPPRSIKECKLNTGPGLFLDTTQLLARVKQISKRPGIQLLPEDVKDLFNNNPISSIKRLYTSWGKLSKRAFPRRTGQIDLKLTLGFHSIYNQVSHKQQNITDSPDETLFCSDTMHFYSHKIKNADNLSMPPEPFNLTDPNDPIAYSIPHMQLRQIDPRFKKRNLEAPTIIECTANVIDESAGGYCLSVSNKLSHPINIGDLVSCQFEEEKNRSSTLCVVRWMKETGHTFLFGIEVIAPFTEAIMLHEITKRRHSSEPIPALLLPQIVSLDLAPTLIIPSSIKLKANSEYLMRTMSDKQVITLHEITDSTGLYNRFRYNAALGIHSAQAPGIDTSNI